MVERTILKVGDDLDVILFVLDLSIFVPALSASRPFLQAFSAS
jgi:hypothetical protein